jgi:hypothetical protein
MEVWKQGLQYNIKDEAHTRAPISIVSHTIVGEPLPLGEIVPLGATDSNQVETQTM